jgi:hypothetical protein
MLNNRNMIKNGKVFIIACLFLSLILVQSCRLLGMAPSTQ